MKNLKRYFVTSASLKDEPFAVEVKDGEYVKFSDIKDILNTSTNTPKDEICPHCGGTKYGTSTHGVPRKCSYCKGTGKLQSVR